jgi:hypothetical protein
MKNLVGYSLPHKLGTINIVEKVSKQNWPNIYKSNRAISNVYDTLFHISNYADKERNRVIRMKNPNLQITSQYNKFVNLFLNKFWPNSVTENPGSFDSVVKCGYEIGTPGIPAITPFISDVILDLDFGDYELAFAPYDDGVMLVHILVDSSKRNKGLGTDVMNMIYDISEENNIPIYLNPYPAESFKLEKEEELVETLKKWYNKIGFGPVSDDSLVWCNFE